MSDDVDEQLRRAMKVLDDQVPSGYFEGLPQRTLARLEDSTIMQTSSETNRSTPPAPVSTMNQKERDEDSGLHDIRSLASSTKARLSSRRSTSQPVASEDDILASSSAGWKAVALPEPAKMVSLPELASLPSRSEVEAADRAARAQLKAELKAEKKIAVATATLADEAPSASMVDAPSIGSRIAAKKSGKGAMIALVGVGLAAAAGAAIYFATASKDKTETVAAASRPLPKAPELTSTTKELPPPPAQVAPPAPEVPAVAAAVPAAAAEPAVEETKPAAKSDRKEPKEKVHKVEIRDTVNGGASAKPDKPVTPPKEEVKAGGGESEPSFDDLLKEAGVSETKATAKPKLDKKSLSGADIKAGMSSVAGKAQGCFAGTQGTAAVKLTVAPSGQVQKVTVTGVFANTPVGACVEKAVKSATFPPWDGGPQSFAYSYLLAE